jgi:hypothetical protein
MMLLTFSRRAAARNAPARVADHRRHRLPVPTADPAFGAAQRVRTLSARSTSRRLCRRRWRPEAGRADRHPGDFHLEGAEPHAGAEIQGQS